MLLNIGFGLTVVAALLLLLIAWGVSWYGDHLARAAPSTARRSPRTRTTSSSRSTRSATTTSSAGSGPCSRPAGSAPRTREARLMACSTSATSRPLDRARAADRRLDRGAARRRAGRDRHRRRRRRPAHEEATTPELRHAWMIAVDPELADGPARADRRGERRRQGQGRPGARGPQGRQGLGRRRQGGVHGRHQGPGRRPRLHRQERRARRAVRRRADRRAEDTPTDVIEGADGDLPHRPGDRDRRPGQVDATLASQVTTAVGHLPQ